MIPSIKAEFRKLFTVRSTYVMVGLSIVLVTIFAFYVEGIRATGYINDPGKLASEVTNAISTVSIFGAIVALLAFAHEYRYGTIMYTLTSSNSRTKTLSAKIIAVSVFAVIFSILIGIYSPLMTYLGLQVSGTGFGPQTLEYADLLWKTVFTGWGYAMTGLLFAALLRNQVAAIAALFLIPTTIEPLLGLILKHNAAYLPFSALQQVPRLVSSSPPPDAMNYLTPGKGALVFAAYLLTGCIIAWILFLRRDAN